MTDDERAELTELRQAWAEAREIAERNIRLRQAAELAVGTLQTALRQLIREMRGTLGPSWPPNMVSGQQAKRWADDLERLLPALEPTSGVTT